MDATNSYRRHGALLSLGPWDAAFLLELRLAVYEPMGDGIGLIGIYVPGDRIDRHIPGGDPALRLIGGIMVERGDERDAIIGINQISIEGLFRQ